jgi:hypothetical protein
MTDDLPPIDDPRMAAVMMYIEDGLRRLLARPKGRQLIDGFLAGEMVFVLGRAAVEAREVPPEVRQQLTDPGGAN